MKKIESNLKKSSAGDQDAALKREISKMEKQVELFQIELKKDYENLFNEEKISMKNVRPELIVLICTALKRVVLGSYAQNEQ
jgi:hypothetical protein